MPASMRSASLPGSARRRWLSSFESSRLGFRHRQGLAGLRAGVARPATGAVLGDPGERVLAVAPGALLHLRQLAHQHVGQADAAGILRQAHRQLLVVHVLVLLGGLAVHEIAVAQRFVGRTHGLEHLVEEQRFEFLGDLADVRFAVAVLADLELVEAVEIGIGAAVGACADTAEQTGIHGVVLRSRSGRPATRRPASGLRGSPSGRSARRRPGSPRGRCRPGWCRDRT